MSGEGSLLFPTKHFFPGKSCEQTKLSLWQYLMGPGGYSGIQQIDKDHKVAIFSMWNEGSHNVKCLEHGQNVRVSDFGGEGTGQKSMMDLDWQIGQSVTLKVCGERVEGGWKCSGWVKTGKDYWKLMAVYYREGQDTAPFDPKTGFYSFIEDWDRSAEAAGYKTMRKAKFFGQKLKIGQTEMDVKCARFTKVTNGLDKFACDRVAGTQECKNKSLSCTLSTGGCPTLYK